MKVLVIGAGLYGRYVADLYHQYGHNVTIIADDDCLDFNKTRRNSASLINQARIHNGYHYPRSLATAMQSKRNYRRFIDDFEEAVIDFDQVYAIPKRGSATSSKQFEEFCERVDIFFSEMHFKEFDYSQIDKTYLCDEKAIDTKLMMKIASEKFQFDRLIIDEILKIERSDCSDRKWSLKTSRYFDTFDLIVNCSYSGINTIEEIAGVELTNVKFEVCEVSMFRDRSNLLKNRGLTIMDGQFVSFMPWSKSGLWSLTSVCYTPHFSDTRLSRSIDVRETAQKSSEMKQQLKRYLDRDIVDSLVFENSKFVVKTVPLNAENDDNRLINISDKGDGFVSILGGKLDAIYEIKDMLEKIGVLNRC